MHGELSRPGHNLSEATVRPILRARRHRPAPRNLGTSWRAFLCDLADERSRPALGEVAHSFRAPIEDVNRSRLDDIEGRAALSLLEQDLPRGTRDSFGDCSQLGNLSIAQPGGKA